MEQSHLTHRHSSTISLCTGQRAIDNQAGKLLCPSLNSDRSAKPNRSTQSTGDRLTPPFPRRSIQLDGEVLPNRFSRRALAGGAQAFDEAFSLRVGEASHIDNIELQFLSLKVLLEDSDTQIFDRFSVALDRNTVTKRAAGDSSVAANSCTQELL